MSSFISKLLFGSRGFNGSNSGIGAFFSGISNLFRKATGSGLTAAEQSTMDWNAAQAAENRAFQSAEAEKAREWQEQYYNQYESPQALIRQYEEAGLNPALLYGNASSGTTPSTSVPSGDSASVGLPGTDAASLLSFVGQMLSVKSVINKNNADADKSSAEADNARQAHEWNPRLWQSQIEKNEASTQNMMAGIDLMQSQVDQISKNIELTDEQIHKIVAETDNIIVDTAKKELEKRGVEVNNKLLAAKIVETFADARLKSAQSILAGAQTNSINLQSFHQQLINDHDNTFGVATSTTPVNLLEKLVGTASVKIDRGLRSLWNFIF